jgi:HSP20 family molecular chaperone IbpA
MVAGLLGAADFRKACPMSRLAGFSSPLMLGFDEIERMLDRIAKSANDGYPPYNIERLRSGKDAVETLRITLAVAGFSESDLEIEIERNQLTIRGRQQEDDKRDYLHRGIAARQFQRSFVLAQGIEVAGAQLENGLLSIDLTRNEPEKVVRKINISTNA